MDIVIAIETPDQPEVLRFLAASDAFHAERYPVESNHTLPIAELLKDDVTFLVARRNGRALGCGGLLNHGDGSAEIKRMWVDPDARGLGLGRKLLDAIEQEARVLGVQTLRLETGIRQPEAIGLYRAAGYTEIPAFPPYTPDPLSHFMEKVLG